MVDFKVGERDATDDDVVGNPDAGDGALEEAAPGQQELSSNLISTHRLSSFVSSDANTFTSAQVRPFTSKSGSGMSPSSQNVHGSCLGQHTASASLAYIQSSLFSSSSRISIGTSAQV